MGAIWVQAEDHESAAPRPAGFCSTRQATTYAGGGHGGPSPEAEPSGV